MWCVIISPSIAFSVFLAQHTEYRCILTLSRLNTYHENKALRQNDLDILIIDHLPTQALTAQPILNEDRPLLDIFTNRTKHDYNGRQSR
ncbi:uncharacterized protein ARMOST_17996 [Armillaria ostoyae]|uniref:Uncharacterized protein n=1 Tax=Armillaria ostoyae TaxID=47428 RepID=A0A284S0L1_ARMOS|nr:uncharacterized protein ARMOST_17996 [Armillaria ostoyae]